MQTELVQLLAYFLAVFFAAFTCFSFWRGYFDKKVPPLNFSDKFKLGYIEDDQSSIPVDVVIADDHDKKLVSEMEKQIKTLQSKLSKIEKREAKKPKDKRLENECIASLMSLGYERKTLAREDVVEFLSKNEISSAEQFVSEFFKKVKKT